MATTVRLLGPVAAVYDRAVHRLDRLLGADPGPRLRAARRQVEEGSA